MTSVVSIARSTYERPDALTAFLEFHLHEDTATCVDMNNAVAFYINNNGPDEIYYEPLLQILNAHKSDPARFVLSREIKLLAFSYCMKFRNQIMTFTALVDKLGFVDFTQNDLRDLLDCVTATIQKERVAEFAQNTLVMLGVLLSGSNIKLSCFDTEAVGHCVLEASLHLKPKQSRACD